MKVRLSTIEITMRERHAINWYFNRVDSPANRELVEVFIDGAISDAFDAATEQYEREVSAE